MTSRAPLTVVLATAVFVTFLAAAGRAQDPPPESAASATGAQPPQDGSGQGTDDHKRIFGIIPNYRTYPTLADYEPITPKEKFRIAADDAFDRGTFVLAGLFGGDAQLTGSTPSFGSGVGAFGKYYAASLTDLVVGDFMTEGAFPTVLRQDPRYFRKGTGNGWSRLGYAVGQIFWTHRDGGGSTFNYSEIGGNAAAVAISTAYYPGNTLSNSATKMGMQVGVDMASNILKEFWPDLDRFVSNRRHRRDGNQ